MDRWVKCPVVTRWNVCYASLKRKEFDAHATAWTRMLCFAKQCSCERINIARFHLYKVLRKTNSKRQHGGRQGPEEDEREFNVGSFCFGR